MLIAALKVHILLSTLGFIWAQISQPIAVYQYSNQVANIRSWPTFGSLALTMYKWALVRLPRYIINSYTLKRKHGDQQSEVEVMLHIKRLAASPGHLSVNSSKIKNSEFLTLRRLSSSFPIYDIIDWEITITRLILTWIAIMFQAEKQQKFCVLEFSSNSSSTECVDNAVYTSHLEQNKPLLSRLNNTKSAVIKAVEYCNNSSSRPSPEGILFK